MVLREIAPGRSLVLGFVEWEEGWGGGAWCLSLSWSSLLLVVFSSADM